MSKVCKVKQVSPLSDTVLKLVLEIDEVFNFKAGQYVEIIFNEEKYPFSIANAPLGARELEFHIRHSLDNPYNKELLENIRAQGEVEISNAKGNCYVDNLKDDLPIVFLAGGTGFAPIKAMCEQILADGNPRKMHLYWASRSLSDLYLDELVKHWEQHVGHFSYTPSLSRDLNDELYEKIIVEKESEIKNLQIVIAGSFARVYKARDAFLKAGVKYIYSDAFEFEGDKKC